MQTEGALASQLRKSFHAKCLCNLIFFHISKRWSMSGKLVAKWDIYLSVLNLHYVPCMSKV